MTLNSLNLPEDRQLLAEWLEELICSEHLTQTALEWEELADVREVSSSLTLAELAGEQLAEIVENGLKGLPEEDLRQLLTQPAAMLELQDRVLSHGSQYWLKRIQGAPDDSTWERLQDQLGEPFAVRMPVETKSRSSRRFWSAMGSVLAIAACLILGFWVIQPPAKPTGWGFNAPGVLESSRSEAELLETLANATHSWFNKRPENREDLALRLKQFDAGCQELLAAELAPLTPKTRQAVSDLCKKTRNEIAGYLAELQQGSDPSAIRDAADQTVTTLEETLRQLKQSS